MVGPHHPSDYRSLPNPVSRVRTLWRLFGGTTFLEVQGAKTCLSEEGMRSLSLVPEPPRSPCPGILPSLGGGDA